MTYLGVDIGTTSVKAVVICKDGNEIAGSKIIHDASIEVPTGHSEQSVTKIISKIKQIIADLCAVLDSNVLHVKSVSICCQMHGVVMWDRKGAVSDLITWQDCRCDKDFLSKLRLCSSYSRCDIHSGYGCATLAWLAQYENESFKKFDCCGTIADYFVYSLCNLEEGIISDHNAESWGFFDSLSKQWDQPALLKSGIPDKIMPRIILAGNTIGKVSNRSFRIDGSADVYVPIGDLQGSVYAILKGRTGKVFNYGTASQLVITVEDIVPDELPPSVRTCLYTKEHKLLTAASLNGGNAIEVIMKLFTSISDSSLSYDDIMRLAMENKDTNLVVKPTFYGERHDVASLGSVQNASTENLTCGSLVAATLRGIIANLRAMMPSDDTYMELPLYAVGVREREVLKYYLLEYFGEFSSIDSVTAATGSVLFNLES